MTDRDRQRRLHIDNRLAELAGSDTAEPEGIIRDPSWGPVGSLLKTTRPDDYDQILHLHESMLALERQRSAVDQPERHTNALAASPSAQPSVRSTNGVGHVAAAAALVDRGPLAAPVVNVDDLEV